MPGTKVVQIRLDPILHRALRRAAVSRRITLADAAREAIRRWVLEETRFAGSPLFNPDVVLGKGPATASSDDDTTVYRK